MLTQTAPEFETVLEESGQQEDRFHGWASVCFLQRAVSTASGRFWRGRVTARALSNISTSTIQFFAAWVCNIPALLACLSFLACSISSSILLDRSASSRPCFAFKLAMRARNWSTDSDPSFDASMVDIWLGNCGKLEGSAGVGFYGAVILLSAQ